MRSEYRVSCGADLLWEILVESSVSLSCNASTRSWPWNCHVLPLSTKCKLEDSRVAALDNLSIPNLKALSLHINEISYCEIRKTNLLYAMVIQKRF